MSSNAALTSRSRWNLTGEVTPLMLRAKLSERERALKEKGVGKAAHLIKDAVFGVQEAPFEGYYDPYSNDQDATRNKISVVCGRLAVQLRGSVIFASWVLFMLTFFEPPHWCRNASNLVGDESKYYDLTASINKQYGDCKTLFDAHGATSSGDEGNQQLYPSTNAMLLTIRESKFLELTCVGVISFYLMFTFGDDGFDPHFFFYPGYKRWIHATQSLVLVMLLMSAIFDNTLFNPFFRVLILGSFLKSFQREMWTFLTMIPKMIIPLSLLAIVVLFYAWFGVVIFYDSTQGRESFSNLAEAMWTLWICITTANYPDVMMPSYNEHRVVALFFISFMVLSFFYIMNLVLAVTVNAYDESIGSRKQSRSEMSQRLLIEAFGLLDSGGGSVSRASIMHVMTILNQDLPEIRGLTDEEKNIMYAILDKDGSNTISLDEFLAFGTVLILKVRKKSDYLTFVETNLPSVFGSDLYQQLRTFVKSKRFEHGVEVILVMNAILVAVQDYPLLAGSDDFSLNPHYRDGSIDTVYELIESIFTALYVIEALLKIMVNGWRRYIESPRNAFDFGVTVLVLLATVYVYYPNAYNDPKLIRFIVFARVLRLSRLLFAIEQFRIYGAISLDIVPAATSVFTVLLFIGYIFGSIGMFLYGGVISRDPNNIHYQSLMEAGDFIAGDYYANNFNDLFSGMNVLFNMLVVNNWTTQSSGLECATGDKWKVRLYMFSFHLLGVVGLSNVITSFIINAFFQQLATVSSRQEPDENADGEAVIRGKEALFDPSTITGTNTGIRKSAYFARITPNYMDIELDERDVLRGLFSVSDT